MERHDVTVIGAGPAGLAVGACLKREGLSQVLLERAGSVGSTWRGHYERLHLHSDRGHSELPYLGFPRGTPRYPSRRQVVDYLDAYAAHFDLPVRFRQEVEGVRRAEGGAGWLVATASGERYTSAAVVVASGYNAIPNRPSWPGEESFGGEIIHSADYRSGERFRGQRVLVVGFGNSGGEIAIDLHEHGAHPTLAVRGPVNVVPRDLLGIPILTWGIVLNVLPPKLEDLLAAPLVRLALGDLRRYGLRRAPYGAAEQIHSRSRIPLLDIGTIGLIKRGAITVRPGVSEFDEAGVRFEDGRREPFDAVVLATGYRPGVSGFLDPAVTSLDERGVPTCSEDCSDSGLHFCGLRVAATGMLREINIESRRIAAAIRREKKAGRLRSQAPSAWSAAS